MKIWLFNPPVDANSAGILRNLGVETIVTSGDSTDAAHQGALYRLFTHYSMVHAFTMTEHEEDGTINVFGESINWFNSGCPNSPRIRANFYTKMEQLLSQPVQGVFLDGIRFSSPASSTHPTGFFDCFCPRCQQDMANRGYEFKTIQEDVRAILAMFTLGDTALGLLNSLRSPSGWMSLFAAYPGYSSWLRYRTECITDFMQEIAAWMKVKYPHKQLAAFLFQPTLSSFVGQDYRKLAPYLDVISPMIYRNYSQRPGPATINQEVSTLARLVHNASKVPYAECLSELVHIFGLDIDGEIPQDPQETLSVSTSHVVAEVLSAVALVKHPDKVVPIVWAGDPDLKNTLSLLAQTGAKNCILFTYDAGTTAHGQRFHEIIQNI
ncbi:MAG: hypothetical protein GX316_01205 [Firmicutes bacterium]|nr:hypothetical protein [Bacillota bacterium]